MAAPPIPVLRGPHHGLITFAAERRWLDWGHRRYGDVFAAKVWPFDPLVMVADPEEAKRIFTADADLLHAGEAHDILEPLVGKGSLIVIDEERHLHRRRLLLPPFHGQRMQLYAQLMGEIAHDHIDRWPVGKAFKLHPSMLELTMRIILRAIFGIEEAARYEELERRLHRMLNAGAVPVMIPALRHSFGGRGPWARYHRLRDEVDEIIFDEIRRHREDPRLAEREDVMALLMQARDVDGEPLPDQELRDELIMLLVAGHETVAAALAWGFERLLRHPDVLARLRASLAEGDDYLDAVIKETLRLRPPLTSAVRRVTRPMEVGGWTVPTGATIAVSMTLIHRNPELYPQPDEFRPERFLEGETPGPYTWLPFGGGVRRCVGAAFATQEMKVVIRSVLERCELEPALRRGEPLGRRAITSVPMLGARTIVRSKAPRPAREPGAAHDAQMLSSL